MYLLLICALISCISPSLSESQFTFIYIVGIEGAGHYGLKELLEHLAHLTGHRVLWRGPAGNRGFRDALWFTSDPAELRNYMVNSSSGVISNPHGGGFADTEWNHTVIVEHASFPFEKDCRSCQLDEIEKSAVYKISWWYNTFLPLKETGEMNMKLLFIQRDWWDTIASHRNFAVPSYDGSMAGHATVMSTFLQHIWNEFVRIKDHFPSASDFRGIRYEWLAEHDENSVECPQLILALYDFLEFSAHVKDQTIIEESCKIVKKMWHKPRRHSTDDPDYASSMALKHDYDFPMLLNQTE